MYRLSTSQLCKLIQPILYATLYEYGQNHGSGILFLHILLPATKEDEIVDSSFPDEKPFILSVKEKMILVVF